MYDYYAVTLDPYYDALSSDRWPQLSPPSSYFLRRHPLYKKAWDAFEIEIPHLVKNSSVAGELKPDIKLIRLMKSTGGFVQGDQSLSSSLMLLFSAHYQITFKRPHWNNSEGFIEAMEEICAGYKLLPAEEGLWGNVTERYVKHDYQVIQWQQNKRQKK